MGIIGAWEVVEEAESSDNEEQSEYSRDTDNKADKVVETPKRKIEETGDFSHASEHFDIREKTIEALPTAHQSNDADGSESAAKGLFKKRRVTGNRSNSRKTIK
ncbi:hypothetical protein GGI07_000057 [Coemansia sp. Benny D115]|nr:hypothetical protein GGI07_000057 [Coemansia sp. Benny D115]